MKFKVALYPSDEGGAVCVPSLPGCWSQGDTVSDALVNIADAIKEYLGTEVVMPDEPEMCEVEVSV